MMKKILVTGASGGIGSQTAVAFAKCGCDVALHFAKNSEKAESLAEKLTNEYGINAHDPMIHPQGSGYWSNTLHIKIFKYHITIYCIYDINSVNI